MKKILLLVMIFSLSLIRIHGMKEKNSRGIEEEDKNQLQHIQENAENILSYNDLIEFYKIIAKSLHLNKTHPELVKKLLALQQNQAALMPPLEIVLHIINSISFTKPIEFLKFLSKFSSLNRHFRTIIKPHIIDLVSAKFALDKQSVKEFLELVFGRSGIPLRYLKELLKNKDKREKIKQLRVLYESDPEKAIEELQCALDVQGTLSLNSKFQRTKPNKPMDIIIALPKKIFYYDLYDLGLIIKRLIDSKDDMVLLKMLIGSGINIDCIVQKTSIDFTALMYAVDHNSRIKVIKLLLKAGANPIKAITLAINNMRNHQARAIGNHNQKILDLLISYAEKQKTIKKA